MVVVESFGGEDKRAELTAVHPSPIRRLHLRPSDALGFLVRRRRAHHDHRHMHQRWRRVSPTLAVDEAIALDLVDDDPLGRAGAPNVVVLAAPDEPGAGEHTVRFDRFAVSTVRSAGRLIPLVSGLRGRSSGRMDLMTDTNGPEGDGFARGATTLMEVLDEARDSGFGGSFYVTSADAVRSRMRLLITGAAVRGRSGVSLGGCFRCCR